MQVIQITANSAGLFAMTNSGKIFYLSMADFHASIPSWTSVKLPAGCWEGPPPLPESDSRLDDLDEELATLEKFELPEPVVFQVTGERKIDLDKLPPKLRSALASDVPTNICPSCGMTTRGGQCIECAITPAEGGGRDD